MEPYKSTRKNPDRYIDRLKAEIEREHDTNQMLRGRMGIHMFSYAKGVETDVLLRSPRHCPELLPGIKVLFKGTVTEVSRDKKNGNIKFELDTCSMIRD